MYVGELDDGTDIDLLLQIMLLSDHYEIEPLFHLCDQRLVKKVSHENCVLIYQHTHLFEATQVKMMAVDCIVK